MMEETFSNGFDCFKGQIEMKKKLKDKTIFGTLRYFGYI